MRAIATAGRRALTATAVLVFVVDAMSKAIAVQLGHVHVNPGIAFGMLASQPALAAALSAAMTAAVIAAAWRWSRDPWRGLGWGLVLGGALGNVADRWIGTAPSGVIDWIRVPFYPAVFNVADVAIRSGALILLGLAVGAAVGEWRAASRGFPSRDRRLHGDPPAPFPR